MLAARRIFPAPCSSRPLATLPSASREGRGEKKREVGEIVGVGRRGQGWGQRGTAPQPATGHRRVHFHHGSTLRPAPGWLKRPGKKGSSGGPPHGGGSTLPECYSPRAAALADSWGQGSQPSSPRSPRSRRYPPPPRGVRRGLFLGGEAVSECTTRLSWPALERPPKSQLIWPK